MEVNYPDSKGDTLAPGESKTIFSGSVGTSADATTQYGISLKAGTSNTYRITHSAGTAPAFRTVRTSGASATTEVSVTKNAKLLIFTSTGGTAFSLISGGVVVGDQVRIGTAFNAANQGVYTIIARSATSFTVENELGIAEASIILGSDFATDVNIYSATGVQIGDKLEIIAGFSSVTFNTYDITDVSHNYIEFYSLDSLPTETAIVNSPTVFTIYRDAISFLYMESDKQIDITLNGSTTANKIVPITLGTTIMPGIFMNSSLIKSLVVENNSLETASIFYVTTK
jgi:hypothetical protein